RVGEEEREEGGGVGPGQEARQPALRLRQGHDPGGGRAEGPRLPYREADLLDGQAVARPPGDRRAAGGLRRTEAQAEEGVLHEPPPGRSRPAAREADRGGLRARNGGALGQEEGHRRGGRRRPLSLPAAALRGGRAVQGRRRRPREAPPLVSQKKESVLRRRAAYLWRV